MLAVGVSLGWQPLFAAGPGRAGFPDPPPSCGPACANPAEWGRVLVGGALLALLHLRYLADRTQVR